MGKIIGSPVFRQHNPATFIRVSMLQVHPASSSFHSTMIILRRSLSVDSAESPMATLRWGWDLWVAGGDFCGGLSKRSHWIWILFGSRTCSVPFIHFHAFSSIFHPSFLWILGKVRTGYPHSHVHCRCGQVGAFNPNSRSRASVRVPVVVSCGATDNFSPLMSSCHVVSAVDG